MKMDKHDAFDDAKKADADADTTTLPDDVAGKPPVSPPVAPAVTGPSRRNVPLAALSRSRPRLDWRRHTRLLLLVAVPLAVIATAGMFWLRGGRHVSTDNAYVKADIVQLASEIQGRLAEVRVRDHGQVAAGDVILRLDAEPYKLALAKAEAEADSARAVVNGAKMSLEEAKAELKESTGRYDYFQAQAKRQRDLATRGVSPTIKVEQTDSDALQAADKLMVARQKIQRILATLGGAADKPTDAYATVREKLALRDKAALDLTYTEIKAPTAGVAVNVKLQPGEQIKAQTPLFAIVADRRPWVEANFKETDLTHVRAGQKASIVFDIYPDITWEAEVDTISPATGAEFAILPPQNASGNWVKVVQRLPIKLRLIQRQGEPPLRAGMTASVSVDTLKKRSLAGLLGMTSAAATK
jgi:membrane fusion protein, multidrug efflux system